TGFARQAATIGVGLAALAIAVRPAVTERLDVDTQVAFRAIRLGELNERDAELIRRGYYENLVGAGRLNSRAWEVGADRPEDWLFIQFTDAGRFTNDFFEKEFVPDASIVFHAAPFVTNQWGFRDQEYDREPSPDTYRVVMLGASYLLGSGVGNNENFEALVERRLNEDLPTGFRRYELLNFARPGFEPLRNAFLLPHALEFEPDAVWVFGYGAEDQAARTHLARMARNGIEIPDPFLRDIVEESGVIEGMGQDEASRLLAQYDDRLVAWAYETMLEAASARGIVPAWIFLPATESPAPERFYAEQAPFLESLGYRTVDLSRVFRGPPIQELQVAPWDGHPNVRGHQIIADSLYRALTADPALVGAGDESP
ncbi:MAG: hypothetical protein OEU54_13790, partial [Gemmatimonadota bacterium]|nr:hypothetical protein [Gemmatimonadota bacterium]